MRTLNEKRNGEMTVRELSAAAQKAYNTTDPLTVWEYETEAGPRYEIELADDRRDGLTRDELEEYLVEMGCLLSEIDRQAAEARRDDLDDDEIINNRFL